jgi:hypothetical protein
VAAIIDMSDAFLKDLGSVSDVAGDFFELRV